MYYKIYDNTLATKFISYLLVNSNVPRIDFYRLGDPIYKDFLYIYRDNLYRAKENYLGNSIPLDAIQDSLLNWTYFEKISPYIFGDEYQNITTNYTSTSTEYNPSIHMYLGDYLRSIRDHFNLNLMPFYNCFNGVYADNIDIKTDKSGNTSSIICRSADREAGYKILLVPIRFGQKYSIYVDSLTGFDYCPVLYGRNALMESQTELLFQDNSINEKYRQKYSRCRCSSFSSPFIVDRIDITLQDLIFLHQFNYQLYLAIKLPADNNSSIVVLEGDYSEIPHRLMSGAFDYSAPNKIIGKNDEEKYLPVTESSWAESMTEKYGPLKLTWINDGQIYAFTDTLIQYLLLNVISNADTIDENIYRVQEYITSDSHKRVFGSRFNQPYISGVWNDEMRNYLFNLMMTNQNVNHNIRLDICGYADMLTEQSIIRGQKI